MVNYRSIACLLFISSGFAIQAQNKIEIEKGEITFTSNAKLELINAASKKLHGRIDPATGQFAFIVKIQSFEGFNSKLQQDHFNENFMETDKYFEATFSGKIIEPIDFSVDGTYDVRAKGNLVIHGKKQTRIIPAKIQIEKGRLKVISEFTVPLVDHDIKIPQLVTEKIATEIIVRINVSMVQNLTP
jgi:polyisoprenoid-binding protein YceI